MTLILQGRKGKRRMMEGKRGGGGGEGGGDIQRTTKEEQTAIFLVSLTTEHVQLHVFSFNMFVAKNHKAEGSSHRATA